MFLLSLLAVVYLSETTWGISTDHVPQWLFVPDHVAGVLGCLALWLRRRHPVAVAVTLAVFSTFSVTVAGALLAALFTVALHRPFRSTLLVGVLCLLTAIGYAFLRPEPGIVPATVLGFILYLGVTGWGLYLRSRRQLLESLRERAVRAAAEAHLRAEQAQLRAREQIAREMHDVLGHRLSLLSVYAGALEYRSDASPAEIAQAARVIRESAHQALQDLREVIGVLRAPTGELPQPTLADVRELIAESERAGMRVTLSGDPALEVPHSVGRTAYRIVQEGLTNARKHAPGAEVRVVITGAAGEGLTVEVDNTALPGPVDPGPGSGQGLIGLTERVSLAGGRLQYGPTPEGGFRLTAWLPWRP